MGRWICSTTSVKECVGFNAMDLFFVFVGLWLGVLGLIVSMEGY